MTNPKDPKELNENQEWEFDAVSPKIKSKNQTKTESQVKRAHIIAKKPTSLALDEGAIPRTKTRSAMAMDIQGQENVELKDEYTFAPLPKRAVAFGLDTIFLAAIIYVVKFSAPISRKLVQYFMDSYKLKFMIPEEMVMKIIMGGSGLIALFFLIVIPIAFFNNSFGKKIIGLRVRGNGKYTISISQAFKRELIFKPLSIAIIAGFITPFFSKKRLSIQDMLADTIVIED
jgi:uncharacterized RDD family membrane protein YckC